MGANGNWIISIRLAKLFKKELLRIHSLNEEKARELFDLIDEFNSTDVALRVVLINPDGNEIDECMLPNIFTE